MNKGVIATTGMFNYNHFGVYHKDRQNLALPLLSKYDNIILKRNCQPSLIDLEKQFNEAYRNNDECISSLQYNLAKKGNFNENWMRLERSNGYVAVSFLFLLFMSSIFTIGVLKENQMLLKN
ncbi:hypothetical protein C6P45_001216 [Maudiozyma exigua]|uniref:Uncharacterized protein n=1 Tax=Maudiozyma exigua TaxID=34358 RepID=A0A9P7B654_MAUEX|nr:hypothetical protein C6P45_001216 [Kazachstania exigua]